MKKALFLGTVAAVMFIAVLAVSSVFAAPASVCPQGGDWVKIDGLSGTSYTYTAPVGYLITEWCYKASTTVNSGSVSPPASSYTVTSTVTNQNGNVQDLSHASFKLEEEDGPEACEETETIYGVWSEWAVDPGNSSREYRIRSITYVDANDRSVVCGTSSETEYRPRQTCVDTYAVYGVWSEWAYDPQSGKEYRTRSVTFVDSVDEVTVCGSDTQTEWREVPPGSCQQTTPVYGEWSDWQVDPESGKEFRTRLVTYIDAADGETFCGEETETEWRDQENLVPYCIDDTTIWVPVGQNPPQGADQPGECIEPPVKILWVAECDICDAVVAIWENIFGGEVAWDSSDLYGDGEEKPVAVHIVEDCINKKSRCDYERWAVAYGRQGKPSEFDIVSDGVDFPTPEAHLGADGQMWITYMNPVGPPENRYQLVMGQRVPYQNSWDDWFLVNDGVRVEKPYVYWPCCLAGSYAFTSQEGGVNYAWKFPGMCQWSWVQFFVKMGLYANPGENNWEGWQYLFDQNKSWYDQFKKLSIGDKVTFPDPITSIP